MDHGRGSRQARAAFIAEFAITEFARVVRRRRMTRSFADRPLPPGTLEHLVDLASRAPSAGKTQGWHLVVLEGDDTRRFWDITLPVDRRDGFRWAGLLAAPVILLPFADPAAYVARYSEPDKAATGLGASADAWPAPYWTIDASMALMTLLLAAEEVGLGALLFGVFRGEDELRSALGVPERLQLLGAVALGWPGDATVGSGRSAGRVRRTPDLIVHRSQW
ncbi:MAG TPA: nitroreductase family protein [Ilumatobacter sp.]|nr:nitroreductase family protein [Ilumatobacter sp.]